MPLCVCPSVKTSPPWYWVVTVGRTKTLFRCSASLRFNSRNFLGAKLHFCSCYPRQYEETIGSVEEVEVHQCRCFFPRLFLPDNSFLSKHKYIAAAASASHVFVSQQHNYVYTISVFLNTTGAHCISYETISAITHNPQLLIFTITIFFNNFTINHCCFFLSCQCLILLRVRALQRPLMSDVDLDVLMILLSSV